MLTDQVANVYGESVATSNLHSAYLLQLWEDREEVLDQLCGHSNTEALMPELMVVILRSARPAPRSQQPHRLEAEQIAL